MRWFWIDCFTEFVSGQRAVAIKNVTLGEPQMPDHFRGYPVMPPPLIVEGMAQTGGTLLGEATQFQARLVLAKIAQAQFFFAARPGDTLRYTTTIQNQGPEGALLAATSHVGDRLQAQAELYLAILGERHGSQAMFEPADFARLMRVLRVYEVGQTADGRPLQMPQRLLELEQRMWGPAS